MTSRPNTRVPPEVHRLGQEVSLDLAREELQARGSAKTIAWGRVLHLILIASGHLPEPDDIADRDRLETVRRILRRRAGEERSQ